MDMLIELSFELMSYIDLVVMQQHYQIVSGMNTPDTYVLMI